jgi:transposase
MFKQMYSRKSIISSIFLYEKLKSFRKVENKTGIGKSTIHRWYNKFHFMLSIRKSIYKKRNRKRKFVHLSEQIKTLFLGKSSLTFLSLKSIQCALKDQFGYEDPPHISTISKYIRQSRISRRRFENIFVIKVKYDLSMKMDIFKTIIEGIDNSEIVCVDETGFVSHGNALYGYFPMGHNPEIISKHKREKYSSVVAISSNGVVSFGLQDEPYNKNSFIAFLKNNLIPNISQSIKYILMDNVAFHHSKDVISLLESNNLIPLFIPPYSPQCNPIEEVFSMTKRFFREQFHLSRSFKNSIDQSFEFLNTFKDFSNYYNHMRRLV